MMVEKEDNPKKSSSSRRAKDGPKDPQSYSTDGIDLPSSGEEDEYEDVSDEEQRQMDARRKQKSSEQRELDISVVTDKEQKKREKKERLAFEKAVVAKRETLKEDHDAYTVFIGSKTSVLEGNANVKDNIKIDSFSVSCRGKELLSDVSLSISHGKRYGLIGPNGMGKSTLLKLLAWRKIPVPKSIDILLVKQEIEADEKSALEAVLSANEDFFKLLKEKEALEKDDDDDDTNKLGEVYEKLKDLEADAAKAHACKILAGLGFTEDMQKNKTESFSGVWKIRISLARALFMEPTLLLLDEPTNHLDLRADLWLTEYLCRWKKMLVVVSHYEDFLNTVCTDIIHLHDKKLDFYRGNFLDFKSGYELRCNEVNKKFEIQEKQKKNAAKSQQKKLTKAEKGQIKKWRDYSVVLHVPIPTEISPPLLKLVDVSFSYTNKAGFEVSNVNVGIDMSTRVAIVGPNGGGKSTLLNLLARDLVPTKGEVRISQKLRIGRYSQHFV